MAFFKRMFSKRKRSKPRLYEEQREALQSADLGERMTLAQDSETNKEILYYLAENDPEPEVRKAVAENESTPVQASPVLAQDPDEDVRLALARRLTSLLPNLDEDKQSQIYAFAVQSLGTLALDEVLKIRIALSSTLKDQLHTPPKIAGQLARDVEREVSEPILRFCAALADEDLLDILMNHPAGWVVRAVAQRDVVSTPVSEAVIETEDGPGGVYLIKNTGADITDDLLMTIVEKSKDYPEWQESVATRPHLPPLVVRELAEFVDASVRDILTQRDDFDDTLADEIAGIFRRRVDWATEEESSGEAIQERLDRVEREGRLNEETISDALAMRDRAFVTAALARMVGVEIDDILKVFEVKAPKSIIALAWKAELSMRMALRLQQEIAHIAPQELIYPREGTEYPFSEEEIKAQLGLLGLS